MEPEKQEDLFEIKLTEDGRNYIIKTAKIAGGTLIIAILSSALSIIATIYRIIRFSSGPYAFYNTRIITTDIFTISIMVLNIFAIIKYWTFIIYLRKGIADVNETQFNQSFKHLYSNIRFLLVVAILNLMTLLIFFVQSQM